MFFHVYFLIWQPSLEMGFQLSNLWSDIFIFFVTYLNHVQKCGNFFRFSFFSNLGDFPQKFIISHKNGCKFQPLAIGCLMDPKGPKGKKKKKKKQTNKHSPLGFDLVICFSIFWCCHWPTCQGDLL